MIPPSLPPSHCHLCGVAENPRASVMLAREAVVGSGTEAAEGQRGKAVTYPLPAALRHLQRQLGYRATLDDALKEAQLIPVICAWCGAVQGVELWARNADDKAWQAVLHKRLSPTAIEALLQAGVTVPGAVLEYLRVVRFSAPRKKRS